MTARRSPSTTSLSKYARSNSPDFANRSLDFCNAFWGYGDGGVDVLFARMRGAMRTMDELRFFWKERALIEDDYAKRLAKLAKSTLGKDEIGDLRNSLDTIRLETDKQAGYHLTLAQQIRNDLEAPTTALLARQTHFKKTYQAVVEKEFKTKNTQESYVNKAKEKYENDCMRINSYTAQSTLMQGRDLERIQVKLERAQQTVQANEKDFANFSKALQDTVRKWEQTWKAFCDNCQDLEEERMDFMKDNMWGYANAVSTVCVADDESCEKLRVALEQFEPDKDMENFVRDYGTGSQLPDPPAFVDYANPDAFTASSSRVTSRPADFVRETLRNVPRHTSAPPPEEEPPATNIAGIGSKASEPTIRRSTSQARGNLQRETKTNGASPDAPGSSAMGGPAMPNTELVIGDRTYAVDVAKDPQAARPVHPAAGSNVGQDDDPLAKQMRELRSTAGSVRRNSTMQINEQESSTRPRTGHTQEVMRQQDYRRSAEMVVGSYPPSSRSASPSQPTAAMMKPPPASSSTNGLSVEGVVADYFQKLPGEKSHSRSNSRQSQHGAPNPATQNKTAERPVSREGFAGIGSQGRSPSPAFNGSRNSSPAPLRPPRQGSGSITRVPPPSANGELVVQSGSASESGTVRTATPNSVGIVLDPTGKVAVDDMARVYQAQAPQPSNQQIQQYHQPPGQASQNPYSRGSVSNGNAVSIHGPPLHQPPYGAPPPVPYGGHTYIPVQQQPPIGYANVPPPSVYVPPPQHEYQHPYAAPPAQAGVARGQPISNVSGAYHVQQHQTNGYVRPVSPMHNAPVTSTTNHISGPAPTGQYTENGAPVLFYVKALYDYTASIEEEFDFQSGDIIAVTSTPEDGWWSGELLDEARRQPGRHVFPSNFVCLF